MGYKVTTPIWDYSRAKGSDLLVLLAIGDSADNTTGDAYPSIETLAELSRLSVRAVQYAIRRLEKIGELSVWHRVGQKTSVYHVTLFDGMVLDRTGAKIAPVGVQRLHRSVVQGVAPDGCKPAPKGVQSTTNAIERARGNLEPVLNQQSLSPDEREICVTELRRLFPSIHSIPANIPPERAYLFWHRVRTGEVQRERIYSPIAYMAKMLDEDISEILMKDRERRARAAGKVTA